MCPWEPPVFKWKEFLNNHGVVLASANFALYGDMSKCMMNVLSTLTPHIEVYSIDEAFLDFSSLSASELREHALQVQTIISRYLGLPVGVGV